MKTPSAARLVKAFGLDSEWQPTTPTLSSDCLITALEAYARLARVTPWTRVFTASFPRRSGSERHAVVIFLGPDRRMWMYEADGSICLGPVARPNAALICRKMAKALGEPVEKGRIVE